MKTEPCCALGPVKKFEVLSPQSDRSLASSREKKTFTPAIDLPLASVAPALPFWSTAMRGGVSKCSPRSDIAAVNSPSPGSASGTRFCVQLCVSRSYVVK